MSWRFRAFCFALCVLFLHRNAMSETFLRLDSQPTGLSGGTVEAYVDPLDANFSGWANGRNGVNIIADGDLGYHVNFAAPNQQRLAVGTYTGVSDQRSDVDSPYFDISGYYGSYPFASAEFTVLDVEYGPINQWGVQPIEKFHATFEQLHDFGAAPLIGEVKYDSSTAIATAEAIRANTRLSPSEMNELMAFSDAIVDVPTGIYLHGEKGSPFIDDDELVLLPSDGQISAGLWNNQLTFYFDGVDVDDWWVMFEGPDGIPVGIGDWGNLGQRTPTKPILAVSMDNQACSGPYGKFIILEYELGSDRTVLRLDAIFENDCFGTGESLYGRVRYNATVVVPEVGSIALAAFLLPLVGICKSRIRLARTVASHR